MNQFESNEFKLPELGLEIIIWSEMVVFHLYIRKMVVVSRWYGGIQLGPDRFKHINNAARNVLEIAGIVSKSQKKDTKNKKK